MFHNIKENSLSTPLHFFNHSHLTTNVKGDIPKVAGRLIPRERAGRMAASEANIFFSVLLHFTSFPLRNFFLKVYF